MTLDEKKQGEYTIEDYYTLPDDRRVELIDGVIYDMNSPLFVHQRIAGSVYFQITTYIKKKKGDCIPLIAPVDVRLDCDDKTIVQPDVMVVCDKKKIERWGIMGAPEFVLEVISPSTKWKDCRKKLVKYEQAGVREYWIIDPYKKKLFIYDFIEKKEPEVYDLIGEAGLKIYQNELKIDLDELSTLIQNSPM